MKRFTLADQILVVAALAAGAYFSRLAIDLHEKGFAAWDITFGLGTVVILIVVACSAWIAFHRRRNASRAATRQSNQR